MFAVIKTGGKQYKIKEGDVLRIEKLPQKVGDKVIFDQVLLISDEKGENVNIGQPLVKKAEVEGEVLEQGKGKKIKIIKYKPKTRYHKKIGHRQPYTKVKILRIELKK